MEDIIPLIKEFVDRNSYIKDLQFDPNIPPKLTFDPYSKSYQDEKKIAHYFLLVASIDEGNVIGRAEYARKLIVYLHKKFGDELFIIDSADYFQREIENCGFYGDFGPLRDEIPQILVSVNNFVMDVCHEDLIDYTRRLSSPRDFVIKIGKFVRRMGGPIQKKRGYI